MKRINDIHNAIGYLLMLIALILFFAGSINHNFVIYLGIPVFIAGLILRFRSSRCPYCKSYITVNMMDMNIDVFHCPKCGGKIEIK